MQGVVTGKVTNDAGTVATAHSNSIHFCIIGIDKPIEQGCIGTAQKFVRRNATRNEATSGKVEE